MNLVANPTANDAISEAKEAGPSKGKDMAADSDEDRVRTGIKFLVFDIAERVAETGNCDCDKNELPGDKAMDPGEKTDDEFEVPGDTLDCDKIGLFCDIVEHPGEDDTGETRDCDKIGLAWDARVAVWSSPENLTTGDFNAVLLWVAPDPIGKGFDVPAVDMAVAPRADGEETPDLVELEISE